MNTLEAFRVYLPLSFKVLFKFGMPYADQEACAIVEGGDIRGAESRRQGGRGWRQRRQPGGRQEAQAQDDHAAEG